MPKTYFITKKYNNILPSEFTNSLNKRYISFQYCRATCNGYLDGETEMHASFIQRDEYEDSLVWYANLTPPDDNRKYEFVGTKREFRIWFTDAEGNEIKPDNFTVFLKLEYWQSLYWACASIEDVQKNIFLDYLLLKRTDNVPRRFIHSLLVLN